MRTTVLLLLTLLLGATLVARPQIGPAPGGSPFFASPHTHAYQESDYILLDAGTGVIERARTARL